MANEHNRDLVDTMLDALLDRGGFDAWWCDIDSEIREEIAGALRVIAERALADRDQQIAALREQLAQVERHRDRHIGRLAQLGAIADALPIDDEADAAISRAIAEQSSNEPRRPISPSKEHCPHRLAGFELEPHMPCDRGDFSRDGDMREPERRGAFISPALLELSDERAAIEAGVLDQVTVWIETMAQTWSTHDTPENSAAEQAALDLAGMLRDGSWRKP